MACWVGAGTRKLRAGSRRHMHQKLASVNLVPVFSGSSFWYGIEHSSIPSQKLCGTWHTPCNITGHSVVLVQETVMNLRQIFPANFCYQFLVRVLPALWITFGTTLSVVKVVLNWRLCSEPAEPSGGWHPRRQGASQETTGRGKKAVEPERLGCGAAVKPTECKLIHAASLAVELYLRKSGFVCLSLITLPDHYIFLRLIYAVKFCFVICSDKKNFSSIQCRFFGNSFITSQ